MVKKAVGMILVMVLCVSDVIGDETGKVNPSTESAPAPSFKMDDSSGLIGQVLKVGRKDRELEAALVLAKQQTIVCLNSYIAQQETSLSKEQYSVLRRMGPRLTYLVNKSFSREKLHNKVMEHIKNNYDKSRVGRILHELRTPQSFKMMRLEELVEQNKSKLRSYSVFLKSNPPSDERMALINKIDFVMEAARLDSDAEQVIEAAFNAGVAPDRGTDNGVLKSKDEPGAESLEVQKKGVDPTLWLYTYRDVSDDELKEYVTIRTSAPFKWLNKLIKEAMRLYFAEAAKETGKALAEILKQYDLSPTVNAP